MCDILFFCSQVYSDVKKELSAFGARVATDIYKYYRLLPIKDIWATKFHWIQAG